MRFDEYLFEKQTITLQYEASDWQDAVGEATRLLENAGAVSKNYYEGILQNHVENGPYYVVVPSFAMPHAAPECGALENGFSLVTLKTPVSFGHEEHDPVAIVLCIAAKERRSLNEEIIVQIMNMLDYEPSIEKLQRAKTLGDLRALFAEIP
jgi:PTS system ascorbate-specific IIA component